MKICYIVIIGNSFPQVYLSSAKTCSWAFPSIEPTCTQVHLSTRKSLSGCWP